MNLKVVTPTRTLVDSEVSELTAPGSVGEFGVLPMHVTFLGQLELGVLTYVEGGAPKKLIVHGGYAEVIDDVVTILADDAKFAEDVDTAAAKAEIDRTSTELGRADLSPEDVDQLLASQRRAELELSVAAQ